MAKDNISATAPSSDEPTFAKNEFTPDEADQRLAAMGYEAVSYTKQLPSMLGESQSRREHTFDSNM